MREFWSGVGDLGRGFRFWATSPRLMLLGALPALIVGAVWVGLLVALATDLDAVSAWLTPFAEAWGAFRTPVRLLAAVAVLVGAALLAGLTFTAVVLTVGDPFYERISGEVERRLGDAPPERGESWVRGLLRALRDGIVLLLASVLVGLLGFLLGLIPVVGAVLGLIFGATVGGWFLVVELTGTAFDARGYRLGERRRILGHSRARVLGFGVATWVLFLIPLGAVVAMPAAVGGATLLTRAALDRAALHRVAFERT